MGLTRSYPPFIFIMLIVNYLIFVFVLKTTAANLFSNSFRWVQYRLGIEYCGEPWIKEDVEDKINDILEAHLFGQPLVMKTVATQIQSHIDYSNKALVLSFHGPPGTGKNFVTQKLAEAFYERGTKSQYYHYYKSGVNFPLKSKSQQYKVELMKDVETNLKKCKKQLFVFDEIDEAPNGVFESIGSLLDYHSSSHKAIFIFLSNTAQTAISTKTLELISSGSHRDQFDISTFQRIISASAFNEYGGLKGSKIIKNHIIDTYVPFLPLEREHVLQCLAVEAASAKIYVTQHQISETVDKFVDFTPESNPIFAVSGCKNLATKITLSGHKRKRTNTEL